MTLSAKLIRPGDIVFDVGSHIGYVGGYFSWLTGMQGKVLCFEPSPLNLPYLKANAARCSRKNIQIFRAAAGDHCGDVPFFMEDLTGQNSTVVEGFSNLEGTSRYNGLPAEYQRCTVSMLTLDSIPQTPNFVKIDVESSELSVLKGMERLLRRARPRIMLESAAGSPATVLLADAGYVVYPHRECNLFAVPREDEDGLRICGA